VRTRTIDGVQVGAIGLGCMGMTWAYQPSERDDERSLAVLRQALDAGAGFIDTSDVYGPFTNELLVGRAIVGRHDEAFVSTKGGMVEIAPGEARPNGRPEHLIASCDGSLQRLGVDRIDLYTLHRVDPTVPFEESWGALIGLVEAGKVARLGLSEVRVDLIERAQAMHPVAAVQSELSVWTRDFLDDVVPYCEEHGIVFVAYSPLGRGYLTGTVSTNTYEPTDRRWSYPRFQPGVLEQNQVIVDAVRRVAERHDCTPGQVALAWTLAISPAVLPIPGTKRPERLAENLAAAQVRLTADDLAELAGLPDTVGERY
jgi:aryl-alcohol dehydrogenase-like predicted oxidoreductase